MKRKVKESGSNRVAVFGNSMGGYAAILFGVLIQADIVNAFVPHTFINDANYVRSKSRLLFTQNNFPDDYFDLNEVIRKHNSEVAINIYFDAEDNLDMIHATYISRLNTVELHPYQCGSHSLVRLLRDSGELTDIIMSSLYY